MTSNSDCPEIGIPCEDAESALKCSGSNHPPMPLNIGLGFQAAYAHLLSTIYEPLLMFPSLCLLMEDSFGSKIISLVLFFSGLTTILQAMFGSRLPTISIPSRLYMLMIVLIMSDGWKCLSYQDLLKLGPESRQEKFNFRFCEVRGAFMAVTLLQILLTITGIPSVVSKSISRTTVGSVMIALSITNSQRSISYLKPGLSFLSFVFLLPCFYLWKFQIPIPNFKYDEKFSKPLFQLIKLFPVIAVILSWIVYQSIPNNDVGIEEFVIYFNSSDNFSVFDLLGWPTFTLTTFLYVVPTVLIQNFLTISYFLMIGHITGKEITSDRITRALSIESFCGVISSVFGIPISVNSHSCMAGLISMTNVKSRKTVLISGIWLIILSVFMDSLFPIVIAPLQSLYILNIFIQGIIMAAGFSLIETSNDYSSISAGLSLTIGMVAPKWITPVNSPTLLDSFVCITFFTSFILELSRKLLIDL